MRPNAGVFHMDWRDEAERSVLLRRTRINAKEAGLRSLTQCEECKCFIVQINTDPGSLVVPRFCEQHQPTTITENNA